ncbi:MAG: bifunctional oligoribonuclease/PAP phosphatase NrnA [Dactylosporangium sp.]|nr:DHH family phosphoesterase [Dactylosporangium sp.]NNJ62199.1 bifunctional oligoribonuclease/PAP phosphatase NrnA [Dactylosporangium sp.]
MRRSGGAVSAAPARRDWDEAELALRALPPTAKVLLVCHVNPDGDALGSMLGFALGLRQLGFSRLEASFSGPPELPETLTGLPGLDLLVGEDQVDPEPDAVLAFDVASLSRLGKLGRLFERAPLNMVLDHHASTTRFGQINLVDPVAAATAAVAERLLTRLAVKLDAAIAECLYIALATDTGSFRFNCTPATHELAARLIAAGLPAGAISQRLFDTRPFGAIRLFGDILARASLEPSAAGGKGLVWSYVTVADLARHGQRPQELEALIDLVRCAEEAEVACLIKPVSAADWTVSLRSKGAVDVSAIAVSLGGGGHRAAAGFTSSGRIDDIMASVRRLLDGQG